MTYGQLKTEVEELLGEGISDLKALLTMNDAVESLFKDLVQAQLGNLLGGPTSVSLAAGAERHQLVSVADPTSQLVTSETAADPNIVLANPRTRRAWFSLVTASGTETLVTTLGADRVLTTGYMLIQPPAFPGDPDVVGWNLYVDALNVPAATYAIRQNDAPLSFSTPYQEPPGGFNLAPDGPSIPPVNNTNDDLFYIRTLSVNLTSGGKLFWEQGDLDTSMFRRASAGIASTSEFQRYAFDLVNGRTIEVRPKLGASVTGEYFWVKKPRRVVFLDAQLPYENLPATAFLRYHTLQACLLSNYEERAAASWLDRAEMERRGLILAVSMQRRNHNNKITRFR